MTAVLVTTKHRGVFFGYLDDDQGELSLPGAVRLTRCRNCIYWSMDCKGFLGLAATGPTASCRIGPAADSVILYDVTSVSHVSEDAVKAWEAAPWK